MSQYLHVSECVSCSAKEGLHGDSCPSPPQRECNNLSENAPKPSQFLFLVEIVLALWLQEMWWAERVEGDKQSRALPTFDPHTCSLQLRTRSMASSWAFESGTESCSTKG